jgi:hypothetical protein
MISDYQNGGLLLSPVAISFGVRAGDLLELPVEIGEIVVTAFEADLRDGHVIILAEQLAGITDAYLLNEVREGLLGTLFKKGTECTFGDPYL